MLLDYGDVTQKSLAQGNSMRDKSSLRVNLILRTRKLELSQANAPEQILNYKLRGYEFVDLLGIRRPTIFDFNARHKDLRLTKKVVIKPNYGGGGSRGVYIVFNEDDIFKVKTSEPIQNWDALIERMEADLSLGVVKPDRWIMEELVCEDDAQHTPARDLKFYCFYGKVGLILEVVRYPQIRHCFWTSDGKPTDTGAYANSRFEGKGFTPDMLGLAERLSREIPAPFMRIDFLCTQAGMWFCEFTPRPGGAWNYDRSTDRLLGDYYLDAEGRLINDLLAGRSFDAFNTVLKTAHAQSQKIAA